MHPQNSLIANLTINTIRFLAVDAIEKANSGHPGICMGGAPMIYTIFQNWLKFNSQNPLWPARDRFILSPGHGSGKLYSTLHLYDYDYTLDDLKNFRQWQSKTPGHPEYCPLRGIETTSGLLSQGFSNGVGMAIAQRLLAARFNRPGFPIFDCRVFGIVSDGDLEEGNSNESASLAGHLGLGNLIYFYDDNHISIDGKTELTFTEDIAAKFKYGYKWQVIVVEDGNNLRSINRAAKKAMAETNRPSLIVVRTHIGFGCPTKQDSPVAHGSPLGAEEIRAAKQCLGWPIEDFFIPPEVRVHCQEAIRKGIAANEQWDRLLANYSEEYGELAQELLDWTNGKIPDGFDLSLPEFAEDKKGMATRVALHHVINDTVGHLPNVIFGSADLAASCKNRPKVFSAIQADNPGGNYIHFGIREHAMAGIANGLATYGLIPCISTFLAIADYMIPSIRMAALSGHHVIYVFTHDSIGVGEDGPTHQPIEQLAQLRAIPGLTVIRPCDANETAEAWKFAIKHDGPVALILTRQDVPILERGQFHLDAENLDGGAYNLCSSHMDGNPNIILIATGSEVHLAIKAMMVLVEKGVKCDVVSMPSWELFEKQPDDFKQWALPKGILKIAIEAGCSQGWHKYVGDRGEIISIDRFGASAPGSELFEKFGFTVENVVNTAMNLIEEQRIQAMKDFRLGG